MHIAVQSVFSPAKEGQDVGKVGVQMRWGRKHELLSLSEAGELAAQILEASRSAAYMGINIFPTAEAKKLSMIWPISKRTSPG
jgi:hypothetical protein